MKEQLEFFKKNGYLVVPDSLSASELHSINEVITKDLVKVENKWYGDRNARHQNVHMLLLYPEFDLTSLCVRLDCLS